MTKYEFIEAFAKNMEADRTRMGLSQEKMAKELDISLSAYKRIVNLETTRVDLYLSYKVYALTQRFTFEYAEYTDQLIDIVPKLRNLTPSQLKAIDNLIDTFME